MDIDAQKRAAAARALDFVRPGMRLGLGTGSTAAFAVGQIVGPVALSLLIAAGGAPEIAWIVASVLLVASAALLAPLLSRMPCIRSVPEPLT